MIFRVSSPTYTLAQAAVYLHERRHDAIPEHSSTPVASKETSALGVTPVPRLFSACREFLGKTKMLSAVVSARNGQTLYI